MDSSRKTHLQQQQKNPGIQSHWVLRTPAGPIAGATVPPETPCQASSGSGSGSGSKGSTERMRSPDTGKLKPTAPLNGVRRCRSAGASSVVPMVTNAQMVMQYTRLLACMDSRASHRTAGARPHYGLPGFLPSPSKNYNSSPQRSAGTGASAPMSPPLAPVTPCTDKRLQDCRPHEAIGSVVEGSVEKRSKGEISMMELTEDDPMDSCLGHGLTKPEAPVTPDQSKRNQDCSLRDVIDLDEEILTEGRDMQRGEIRQSPVEEQTSGLPSPSERFSSVPSQQEEEFALQDDTSAERAASHQQETEEGDSREKQGKNLSRTPRQKIKRKKHRPKVIREGKPAKTPKPLTPNQATEKKNQIVKRHYVRKKKGPDSSDAPSEVNRDTASGAAGTVIQKPRGSKPVRRRLNFDSEDQAPDVHEAATPTNGKSQAQGLSMGASNATGTKSTMKLPQGLEVVLENTDAGFAFDLNRSLNQVLEEYIRSPISTTPDWPSTEGLIRDFKQQAKVSDMKETISDRCSNQLPENPTQLAQPSRIEAIGENLKHGSNIPSDSILKEDEIEKTRAKRDCSHVDDTQTCYMDGAPRGADFVQAYEEINQVNKHQDMNRPVLTYKKRRTERVQDPKYNQKVQCTPTYSTLSDLQMERTPEKAEGVEQMLAFDRTKGTKKKRSELRTRVRKPASLATILECNQLSSGYQPQDCMEALNSDLRLKLKTKKRSKKRQVSSISSNTNQVGSCNYKSIKHRSLVLAASSVIRFKLKNAYHRRNSSIQDCESISGIQASLRTSTQSQAIVRYVDPIDDIVQKLKRLNISGGQVDTAARGHGALIPYGRGGMMVPHKGPPRKRRPRAKVDLDPETNRVWKLLMGKEAHDEADGSEMDKEKWWEEQRLVFNGRVKSFIARMHLVQGDRRFSQWKGSVVDSVVGVFLTQNVSDNLSSSAFMSLAARFPVQSGSNNREPNATKMNMSTPQGIGSILLDDDTIKWQEEILGPEVFDQGSIITHEDELIQEKDVASSDISLGSIHTGGMLDYIKGKGLHAHGRELQKDSEAPEIRTYTITGSTSSPETEDRRTMEDVVSSQNSVFSSENSLDYLIQAADQVGSSSERNSEADLIIERKCSGSDSCTSWIEFIDTEENKRTQKPNNHDAGRVSPTDSCNAIAQQECTELKERKKELDGAENVNCACSSIYTADSHCNHTEHNFRGLLAVPSMWTYSHVSSFTELLQMEKDVVREEIGSDLSLAASEVTYVNNVSSLTRTEATCQEKLTTATNAQALDSHAFMGKISQKLLSCSETDVCLEKHSFCHNLPSNRIGTSSSHEFSQFQDEHGAKFQQEARKADFQVENTQHAVDNLVQMQQCEMQNTCSNSCEISEAVETVESNTKNDVSSSQMALQELEENTSRTKRVKAETGKNTFDWDNLRKEACCYGAEMKRSNERLDSLDWEAVRSADVDEISQAIRGRGMNNVLAERIKNFLDRLVRDHGSIDLEWLRNAPPDKAKEYLLSIRGLGLKSVECVRLLTLNNHAFPVDTNVGRICVRLGWVPLQPLPESLQLHLLELYPVMETIQKYLWPRLCRLDQQTLYELHYQMITFGKVFCTKRRPNCNACPMRGECRHFASEFASARLALPGPESRRDPVVNTIPLPQLEGAQILRKGNVSNNCEPIIEEPATPEPECLTNLGSDMEDFYSEDPNEIPQIEVNLKGLTQNLLSLMQENNMELQDGDLSKAIVAITTEAASIPMPKLKNVTRLRTEHQVYELPDSHPLLESLDRREPDDPCPYLLAIWTPGETARSTEPPETCCTSQDTGKLCYNRACFACNSTREAQAQTVRGTLLIPCRTAMRGSFPLNGTYFQVNEVFADHDSSCEPIYVPREWIWNLPRRTVYFGSSVPTIFRGLTTESIQHCFWRGYVCVRGFDRTTRGPRPLKERLHCSAYRAFKNKKTPAEED